MRGLPNRRQLPYTGLQGHRPGCRSTLLSIPDGSPAFYYASSSIPEFPVGLCKSDLLDVPKGHPIDCRVFQRTRFGRAVCQPAPEPLQAEGAIRVIVLYGWQDRLFHDLNQAGELLFNLPSHRIRSTFAFLHLPTGKLPPSREVVSVRTLAKKDTLLSRDQGTHNIEHDTHLALSRRRCHPASRPFRFLPTHRADPGTKILPGHPPQPP